MSKRNKNLPSALGQVANVVEMICKWDELNMLHLQNIMKWTSQSHSDPVSRGSSACHVRKCLEENLRFGVTSFYKTYLDAAYLLCLSPFRLKFNSTGKYTVASWTPQKVMCVMFNLLGFFWILRDNRLLILEDPKNPVTHFRTTASLLDTILKFVVMKQHWLNQNSFLRIVNFIAGENCIGGESPNLKTLWKRVGVTIILPVGLILLYTGIGIINWLSEPNVTTSASALGEDLDLLDRKDWWLSMVKAGKFNFFLSASANNSLSGGSEDYSTFEAFLGILALLGYLQRFGGFCNLLV